MHLANAPGPRAVRSIPGPSTPRARTRPAAAAQAVSSRLRADALALAASGAMLSYVWRIHDLYPILNSVKLPTLTSLLTIALFAANGDARRALGTIWSHPIIRVVVFILGLAVLSVPTSVHDGLSFRFITDDFGKTFVLMLILAASVRGFADLERYAFFLLCGGVVYAQYVYLNVSVESNGRLGDIVYYDANDLGMLLVATFPIAVYFLLRGKGRLVRLVALVALPLFVLMIIKSGSRGAFLGLIGVGAYFLFGFSTVAKKTRVLAVAGVFLGLVVVGSEQYWQMMGTLLNPKADYNWSGQAETGRMQVWKRGMGYMMDRPITGVGIAAFPIAEGTLSDLAELQELGIGLKWSAAHNSFVQIGAELGVLGLAAFLLLLFRAYRTAQFVAGTGSGAGPPSDEAVLAQALAGALVGYAICGFFLSQAYGVFAFTLYALIVGLSKSVAPAAVQPAQGGSRSVRRIGA